MSCGVNEWLDKKNVEGEGEGEGEGDDGTMGWWDDGTMGWWDDSSNHFQSQLYYLYQKFVYFFLSLTDKYDLLCLGNLKVAIFI